MSQYVEITPQGEVRDGSEPFRFTVAGERFELPALDSPNIPLPLIPIFLAMSGGQVESEEERMRVAGTFIQYLQVEEPKLWRALKRQPDAIRWVVGLIEQWGQHSGMDPQPPASGA